MRKKSEIRVFVAIYYYFLLINYFYLFLYILCVICKYKNLNQMPDRQTVY